MNHSSHHKRKRCRSCSPSRERDKKKVKTDGDNILSVLPVELLAQCLSFVGEKSFRYIAPVCKSFHKVCHSNYTKMTNIEASLSSPKCVEIYMKESTTMHAHPCHQVKFVVDQAAKFGRIDIFEWILDTFLPCGFEKVVGQIWNKKCVWKKHKGKPFVVDSVSNCFWDSKTVENANRNEQTLMLKWLQDHKLLDN